MKQSPPADLMYVFDLWASIISCCASHLRTHLHSTGQPFLVDIMYSLWREAIVRLCSASSLSFVSVLIRSLGGRLLFRVVKSRSETTCTTRGYRFQLT